MAGTVAGGRKAAQTNKERYGKDFYRKTGALGGSVPTSKPKGFAANKELARIAGIKGGTISRRGKKKEWKKNTKSQQLVKKPKSGTVSTGLWSRILSSLLVKPKQYK